MPTIFKFEFCFKGLVLSCWQPLVDFLFPCCCWQGIQNEVKVCFCFILKSIHHYHHCTLFLFFLYFSYSINAWYDRIDTLNRPAIQLYEYQSTHRCKIFRCNERHRYFLPTAWLKPSYSRLNYSNLRQAIVDGIYCIEISCVYVN